MNVSIQNRLKKIIYDEIKKPVELCFKNEYYNAMIKLIYSSIDNFVYMLLPDNRVEVTKEEYISWCDRFLYFKSKQQIRGIDLYAARCGVLHTNSSESKLSREEKAKEIGYIIGHSELARLTDKLEMNFIVIEIEDLLSSFYYGIDMFLTELLNTKSETQIKNRLEKILTVFDWDEFKKI